MQAIDGYSHAVGVVDTDLQMEAIGVVLGELITARVQGFAAKLCQPCRQVFLGLLVGVGLIQQFQALAICRQVGLEEAPFDIPGDGTRLTLGTYGDVVGPLLVAPWINGAAASGYSPWMAMRPPYLS